MSPWLYKKKPVTSIPDEYIGFVYIITNILSGRQYIGKKLAKFSKVTYSTVKLKNGKKKRKKIKTLVDSDWQTYWSSSNDLKNEIKQIGYDKFKREILCFCKTKNELSYFEAKYQFERDVLLNESKWYNAWIYVKVRRFKN